MPPGLVVLCAAAAAMRLELSTMTVSGLDPLPLIVPSPLVVVNPSLE